MIPDYIIEKEVFRISDERLHMLARLFDYYSLRQEFGWRFVDFVYKYERGIYNEEFPYPGRERKAIS